MYLQHDVRTKLLATALRLALVLLDDLVDAPVCLKVVDVEEARATQFTLELADITAVLLAGQRRGR